MASGALKLKTVALALIAVAAIELLGSLIIGRTPHSSLLWLGALRLIETGTMVWIIASLEGGLSAVGWQWCCWPEGMKKGVVWSMGFALAAGGGMLLIYLTGRNPLPMLRSPLPTAKAQLTLFFIVGGLIAPVAEELLFRGILYSYFRRWGIVSALAASTVIFVALHATRGFPVTQIVGGVVFAIAFEFSRNLMVPITIHALGNLAIFSLSLLAAIR